MYIERADKGLCYKAELARVVRGRASDQTYKGVGIVERHPGDVDNLLSSCLESTQATLLDAIVEAKFLHLLDSCMMQADDRGMQVQIRV